MSKALALSPVGVPLAPLLGHLLLTLSLLLAAGCAGTGDGAHTLDESAEPTAALEAADFLDHETPEDLEPQLELKSSVAGIPDRFNRQHLMDDDFFIAADAVTVAQVQAFFESNPYGQRSFLADERVGSRSAAEAIVTASRAEGINPVVMVARMQVEKSLVAQRTRPARNRVDFAFGCGCPDNRACNEAYRGLDKQIACAARTLRRHYDGSAAGNGLWVRGRAKRTLDPISITPANHATASLYAYTPWVQEGRGGNWLNWNVTLRFARHFAARGPINIGGGPAPAPPPSGGGAGLRDAWIGDVCQEGDVCGYGAGTPGGLCQGYDAAASGMCSLACEGFCPDRRGRDTTFCAPASYFERGLAGGRCTVVASANNGNCSRLPGMEALEVERHVGRSGVSATRRSVCVPRAAEESAPPPPPEEAPPPESPPEGSCPAGLDALGRCEGNVAVRCRDGEVTRNACGDRGLTCTEEGGARCVDNGRPPEAPPEAAPRCPDGLTEAGRCESDTLVTCEDGRVTRYDCQRIDATCGLLDGRAFCLERPAAPPPPAGGGGGQSCRDVLGQTGRCTDNNMAQRCDGEIVVVTDCNLYGQQCGIGPSGVASCRPTGGPLADPDPECPNVAPEGFCHGNAAVWCEGSASFVVDCTWSSRTCAWADDGQGYWCR